MVIKINSVSLFLTKLGFGLHVFLWFDLFYILTIKNWKLDKNYCYRYPVFIPDMSHFHDTAGILIKEIIKNFEFCHIVDKKKILVKVEHPPPHRV